MKKSVTFHVCLAIRLNYRPFGNDNLYDPALAAACLFTRAKLAGQLKLFFENLIPGFVFEVRIDATKYGPGDDDCEGS